MGNLTRTIQRTKARLAVSSDKKTMVVPYKEVNGEMMMKKVYMPIQGKSKAMSQIWEKIQTLRFGRKNYLVNYVRCDPKTRWKKYLITEDGVIIRKFK